MDKFQEILAPHERKEDDRLLYGKNAAGTQLPRPPAQPHTATVKSPLAQGHIQDDEASSANEGDAPIISAPAEVTGMTGQYITGKDPSPISDQERKKHGTAVGLASATMTSAPVRE